MHNNLKCPKCGHDIIDTRTTVQAYDDFDDGGYRCSGCKKTFTDDEVEKMSQKQPPKEIEALKWAEIDWNLVRSILRRAEKKFNDSTKRVKWRPTHEPLDELGCTLNDVEAIRSHVAFLYSNKFAALRGMTDEFQGFHIPTVFGLTDDGDDLLDEIEDDEKFEVLKCKIPSHPIGLPALIDMSKEIVMRD